MCDYSIECRIWESTMVQGVSTGWNKTASNKQLSSPESSFYTNPSVWSNSYIVLTLDRFSNYVTVTNNLLQVFTTLTGVLLFVSSCNLFRLI